MANITSLYQDKPPEKRRYRVRYRLGPRGQSFTLNKIFKDHGKAKSIKQVVEAVEHATLIGVPPHVDTITKWINLESEEMVKVLQREFGFSV